MVYKIRVILDAKEDIFRDLAIDKKATLEDLHNTISQSFGFAGNEMASFYTCDEEWNQDLEIALFYVLDNIQEHKKFYLLAVDVGLPTCKDRVNLLVS